MVNLAVLALGRGPFFPSVGLVEDVGVLLAFERGFVGFVLLQPIQLFQEKEPRSLLGVVQFGGAAGLFPEDVVDVFEGLFKHVSGFLTGPQGRPHTTLYGIAKKPRRCLFARHPGPP